MGSAVTRMKIAPPPTPRFSRPATPSPVPHNTPPSNRRISRRTRPSRAAFHIRRDAHSGIGRSKIDVQGQGVFWIKRIILPGAL